VIKANGVEELFISYGLSLYPNPSESDFTLTINQFLPIKLVVYNMFGESVDEFSAHGNQLNFGSNLTSGVYMVKATIAGKNATFKIVKQ